MGWGFYKSRYTSVMRTAWILALVFGAGAAAGFLLAVAVVLLLRQDGAAGLAWLGAWAAGAGCCGAVCATAAAWLLAGWRSGDRTAPSGAAED